MPPLHAHRRQFHSSAWVIFGGRCYGFAHCLLCVSGSGIPWEKQLFYDFGWLSLFQSASSWAVAVRTSMPCSQTKMEFSGSFLIPR